MKFSLSNRQEHAYLSQADEIRVAWRDRNSIPDLAEKYPTAKINLTRFYTDTINDPEIDWKQLNELKILSRNNFILGLSLLDEMLIAKANNYDFYYLDAIRTYQELRQLKQLGVCRVQVGAPLFFELEKVAQIDIPIYAIANIANSNLQFCDTDGVVGTWIRPEDLPLYEQYIDLIEFRGNLSQEQALYRIYTRGSWSGDLRYIILDLDYPGANYMISPELAEKRIRCGQRCQENGVCKLCYRMLDLADPDKIKTVIN